MALAACAFAALIYVYLTLPDVRGLATRNPTTTAFMELRAREAAREGRPLRREHVWVPYRRISHHLKRAVLVAEDSAFFDHEGLDVEQLRKAIEEDLQRGAAMRGASTITQQLAKNLYLSPSRNPLRKLSELIIARRLEAALPKARIFEIYLNVIEWGEGIWGAEAAARTYFRSGAATLSRDQAALLAGAIINPRVHSPGRPTERLRRRQRIILGRMGGVEPPAAVPSPAPAHTDTPSLPDGAAPAPEPPSSDMPPDREDVPVAPVTGEEPGAP